MLHLGGGGRGGLSQSMSVAHERTCTQATEYAGTAGRKPLVKIVTIVYSLWRDTDTGLITSVYFKLWANPIGIFTFFWV